MDQYAVMGHPIGHSKSPKIHTLFAAQTQQPLEYRAILVDPGTFPASVDQFRQAGGRGLNITVPFKQEAWAYADQRSSRAERAGAVNTLIFADDGKAYADNTDGVGLVRDLQINHQAKLAGKRILLLGAGGAARGVLQPLLATQPARLVIANRTSKKAFDLAQSFAELGPVSGGGFEDLLGSFDVIINATAAGLADQVPLLSETVLAADCCCYDMMYGDCPTAFVRWARAHGAGSALDGLGMLVEQAAESFFLWRGLHPDTQAVISALREWSVE